MISWIVALLFVQIRMVYCRCVCSIWWWLAIQLNFQLQVETQFQDKKETGPKMMTTRTYYPLHTFQFNREGLCQGPHLRAFFVRAWPDNCSQYLNSLNFSEALATTGIISAIQSAQLASTNPQQELRISWAIKNPNNLLRQAAELQ